MPDGHPDRARMLANLSFTLRTRYERTGQPADRDAAVEAGREAGAPLQMIILTVAS